jgi:peptide/nickel transport system ATP-binding protein
MSEIVRAIELHKAFQSGRRKVAALNGVSLLVREGECISLVGESGCGKSTLARILVGIEQPDHGEVHICGLGTQSKKQSERRRVARLCQMVFQDPAASLNPRHRIRTIIEEPLIIHNAGDRVRRKRRVLQLTQTVGLPTDCLELFPHQLSGGQRQRVGIARALALSPRVIIADEPVSALDVSVQAQILNLLHELRETLGLTLILVSHDLQVVRWVSDRVAVMYAGEIVEIGNTDEVFNFPLHPYTRLLLDSAPRLNAPLLFSKSIEDEDCRAKPGCNFKARCPMAQPHCNTAPALEGSSRQVACFEAPSI